MFGLILQRFVATIFYSSEKNKKKHVWLKKIIFGFFVLKIIKYDVFKKHFYFFRFVFKELF